MRWVLLALVLLCFPSVFADTPTLSIDPSSGPLGTTVTLTATVQPNSAGDLTIYSVSGVPLTSQSCGAGTASCAFSQVTTIDSADNSFYAEYFTGAAAPVSPTVVFDVVDNTPPVFSEAQFVPDTGEISVPASMNFEVTDDVTVESVTIDFGDGSSESFPCGQSLCRELDISHTYELPNTYAVTFTAADNEGLENTKTEEIEISSQLDSDSDGIPDEQDDCVNTPADLVSSVSSSGEAVGCACAEIDADDFDDGNLCTLESCVISDGELEILHESVEDGSSPGSLSVTVQSKPLLTNTVQVG